MSTSKSLGSEKINKMSGRSRQNTEIVRGAKWIDTEQLYCCIMVRGGEHGSVPRLYEDALERIINNVMELRKILSPTKKA